MAVPSKRGWVPRLPALRQRDFQLLNGATVLNAAGMTGEQVIVAWIVLGRTDSSFMVGVAFALSFLPMVLLGLPAGAAADWLDRRVMLRTLDTALVVLLGGAAALLAFDLLELWHILALTFAAGSMRAMHHPVRLSFANDIVGPGALVSGLSVINLSTRIGGLFGAVIAGSLVQRLGSEYAYAAMALLHLGAVAALFLIRIQPSIEAAMREPILENLSRFAHELHTNRTLLLLVGLTAAVEILGFSFQAALPELVRDELHVGAEGLGIMRAFAAIGGIVAILALSTQGEVRRKGITYIGVIALFGSAMLALGAAQTFGFALAILAVVAGMAALSDVLTQALMHVSVPVQLKGRAMGSWVFAIGAAPLGHLQMGALAAVAGAGAALTINGAALVGLAMVIAVFGRRIRRL